MIPPIDGLAAAQPLTSDTVWELERLPGRLLVLGGGAIGCELGQAFARLGSAVTIVEAEAHLLPREAPDIGRFLARCLAEEGVTVRAGARVQAVRPVPPSAGPRATGADRVASDGGVVLVSHDHEFVAQVCDQVIVLREVPDVV